jgi:predicted phage terminase large subunit-like protein
VQGLAAELSGLSEAEQQRLLALLEAQHGGESLSAFVQRMCGLPPPPHIERLLIPQLEEAAWRSKRIVICMPPRHGKSHTVMHALAWHMLRNQSLVHAYVSYNEKQTAKFSGKIRRIAERAGLQLASQRLDYWTTHAGGGLNASSSLTGEGITGWMVIDDPFKDREDAESPVEREKRWDWFTDVAYTRLQPGSSVICIQTRWHTEDLAGRLLALGEETGETYELVEMPAVRDPESGEPTDDFKRGVALWPEMYPLEKLWVNFSQGGAYSFWSLYNQRPRPRGTQLFREPARFHRAGFQLDGHRLIWAVDPAATAKTSADYSVAVLLAVKGHGEKAVAWVLDVVRVQEDVPSFTRRVAALARRQNCGVAVESVGGFKAVPQMLREIAPGLRVLEVVPSTDKFVRAQSLSAAWNQERVLVPDDTPWAAAFVDEFRSFTGLGDSHDDQVDATAHGWNALYGQQPAPIRRGVISAF